MKQTKTEKPKKKAARKRAACKSISKKSQPKKAAKKKAAKRPRKGTRKQGANQPQAGKKGGQPRTLDRRIYAEARARGTSKGAAAVLAGSKATTAPSRTQAGTALELDPVVLGMMEQIRAELIIKDIKDPWEKSKAVMEQMLAHPEWRARGTATNFFAKVVGGYAPDKVELSGSIETTPAGEIGKLSKTDRDKLRKMLDEREA